MPFLYLGQYRSAFCNTNAIHQAVALAELGSQFAHQLDNRLLRKSDLQTFKGDGKAEGVLRGEACLVAFALRQSIVKSQNRLIGTWLMV